MITIATQPTADQHTHYTSTLTCPGWVLLLTAQHGNDLRSMVAPMTPFAQVHCLNEAAEGSCTNIFKPWSERMVPTLEPLCSNDDDPEILLHVP